MHRNCIGSLVTITAWIQNNVHLTPQLELHWSNNFFFVSHYSTFSPWTQQQFKLYFFRGHATSLIRKSTLSISLLSASLVWCECNHTWFSRLRNLFVSSPFHSFSSLSLDFLQALCREWPVWQRPPGNSATALGAIYWPLGTLTVAAIIW